MKTKKTFTKKLLFNKNTIACLNNVEKSIINDGISGEQCWDTYVC